jgi:hypothetical protein
LQIGKVIDLVPYRYKEEEPQLVVIRYEKKGVGENSEELRSASPIEIPPPKCDLERPLHSGHPWNTVEGHERPISRGDTESTG